MTELGPQRLRHEATGATVASVDRFTIEYALGERRWLIGVERGPEYSFFIPARPTWSDGTPITGQDAADALRVVEEAHRHWGIPCHFDRRAATPPNAPEPGEAGPGHGQA